MSEKKQQAEEVEVLAIHDEQDKAGNRVKIVHSNKPNMFLVQLSCDSGYDTLEVEGSYNQCVQLVNILIDMEIKANG